ncbi:ATP-binding protein [Streptomyces sp. B1866]|uniref:ATP-binding protein n=1 Tax=Streptomyces sp. B1866 TaxID=3075431 RepID=UPI00288CD2F1|nr:ATP-binding protein [Streptomyces sp. B1866]MDT3396633.1 ATP-binding protein [Streptomyces sp. B1866]
MADDFAQRYERHLNADPQLLADVRRAVGARLRRWGREELITAAAMCVTELLSNVHKHAASPECVLTLENRPRGIRAAVRDTDAGLPVLREPDFCSESGRGLFLLSKTAHAWGTAVDPSGKTVWFVLHAETLRP